MSSEQPLVHWLAPVPRTVTANYLATGVVQTALTGSINSVSSWGTNLAATHWYWNAGLQGQNMVVGMGDTGMDVFHCHISDNRIIPSAFSSTNLLLVERSTGYLYFDSTTHRKVRYYRLFKDNIDANGHGTHCAGSAVGSPQFGGQLNWSDWQGMAPGAKIAFQDLGDDRSGSIYVPVDASENYFPYTYARGARVHSDSWGTINAVAYDGLAAEFDEFCNENQDFVPVVAAGNFGFQEVDSTVTSPAVAKNCIAVGAGLTAPFAAEDESEDVSTDASVFQMNVTGGLPGSGVDGSVVYKVMQAAYGPSFWTALVQPRTSLRLTAASPNANGCMAYPRGTSFRGYAVLITRGNCSFAIKTYYAMNAGASAVLISNNQSSGFFRMSQTGYSGAITVPTGTLPQNAARAMYNALVAGNQLTVAFSNYTLPTLRYESIAAYSSIGPTLDGRYKPDIIAPGSTLSARAAPTPGQVTCAIAADRGTSMATPIVAGTLLLVRQYFVEGWYPSGAKRAANAVVPSGSLMKAVLLGGAAQMEGLAPSHIAQYDGVPLDPTPSSRQGYGRARLSTTLPLANGAGGSDTGNLNLQVVDWVPMRTTGQVDQYCVQASNGPIKVTLVWADPPADLASSVALVNDLDLTVHADSLSGYSLRGNGAPDHVNNVEQVSIPNISSGIVVITVSGFSVPVGPQNYSLAVQGAFTGELESPYNPGWSGIVASRCRLPITTITAGPATFSNASTASLSFNASEVAPAGFECTLVGQGGRTMPAPLFPWRTCTSPLVVNSLTDGRYIFQARASGYQIQDSRIFTIDRTPPLSTITSAVANRAGSQRSATFSFTAVDSVAVTFQCRLQGDNPQGFIQGVNQLGAWEDCTSPQEYLSMPAGNWSFSVRALDAAGNLEAPPFKNYAWSISLDPGYPIISVNITAISSDSATFEFAPAASALRRMLQQYTYVCTLSVYNGREYLTYEGLQTCTSPVTYSSLNGGLYQFSVEVQNAPVGQAALAQVDVVTSGPEVALTSTPARIVSAPSVSFQFASGVGVSADTDASSGPVTFQCQLQGSGGTTSGYTSCTSPQVYRGLADGNYIFLVQAVALSGMAGPTVRWPFALDATPPTITNITFTDLDANTPATQTPGSTAGTIVVELQPTFIANWSVTDALLGSGVNRSYCFFDTPANVAAQVQRARVNSAGNTACDVRNTHQYTVASNPYAFAIVAFDNANNYVQSAQYELRTGATNAAGTQPELTGGLAALLILWAILLIF